jgi:hypothetical protein
MSFWRSRGMYLGFSLCRFIMIYSLSLGSYWHGHNCHINRGKEVNETRDKPMVELLEETQKNSAYIRKQGYNLVECWECEWRATKKTNKELQRFIATRLHRPLDKMETMSMENILTAVRNETLFGCVECDIHVPDNLRDHFQEMCPIFKNIDISRDDIGEFMKTYKQKKTTSWDSPGVVSLEAYGRKEDPVSNSSVKVVLRTCT